MEDRAEEEVYGSDGAYDLLTEREPPDEGEGEVQRPQGRQGDLRKPLEDVIQIVAQQEDWA